MSTQNQKGIPKELIPEFDAIHRAVRHLFGYWQLYTSLRKPEHLALMKDTVPDAFGLIMVALRNEITMAHGRLLDPAETQVKKEGPVPNLSLPHLIKTISAHCPDVAASFAAKLQEAKDHCEPMITWRRKFIGHSDWKTVLFPETDPLPSIDQDAIEEGMRMLGELVNEIDTYYNKRTTPFEHVLMDGTGDDLMRLLRKAHEAPYREMKEKYGIDLKAIREGRP